MNKNNKHNFDVGHIIAIIVVTAIAFIMLDSFTSAYHENYHLNNATYSGKNGIKHL